MIFLIRQTPLMSKLGKVYQLSKIEQASQVMLERRWVLSNIDKICILEILMKNCTKWSLVSSI